MSSSDEVCALKTMGVIKQVCAAALVAGSVASAMRSQAATTPTSRRATALRAARAVASAADFSEVAREYNEQRTAEMVSIALRASPDIDFAAGQELAAVSIAALDEDGLLLEEVLCDHASDTCVALSVPIAFARRCESEEALRAELDQMAAPREPLDPSRSGAQPQSAAGLLEALNGQFGDSLRLFVLRRGGVALPEAEVLARCRAVDLDEAGFTLENVVCQAEGDSCEVVQRRVLFSRRCGSAEEMEDALCRLLGIGGPPEGEDVGEGSEAC